MSEDIMQRLIRKFSANHSSKKDEWLRLTLSSRALNPDVDNVVLVTNGDTSTLYHEDTPIGIWKESPIEWEDDHSLRLHLQCATLPKIVRPRGGEKMTTFKVGDRFILKDLKIRISTENNAFVQSQVVKRPIVTIQAIKFDKDDGTYDIHVLSEEGLELCVGEQFLNSDGVYQLMNKEEPLNWNEASTYLYEMEKAYKEIGASGEFGLQLTLNPLKLRYEAGERTKELYDDIMNIQ